MSATSDYHDALQAFEQLRAENKLTIRVYEQAQLPTLKALKEFINLGYCTGSGDEFFKIGPLKMLGDGSLGARTAFLSKLIMMHLRHEEFLFLVVKKSK